MYKAIELSPIVLSQLIRSLKLVSHLMMTRLTTLLSLLALNLLTPSLATAIPGSFLRTGSFLTPRTSNQTPTFSFEKLYSLTTTFFDAFLYPKNQAQTLSINSTFFADDILGRVDVSRNFDGRELNTEYLFGLFSALDLNPKYFSLLGLPLSYEFVHFTANENIVSVALIVEFEFKALKTTSPVELDVWLTYNADGQISQYDATFRRLDWQFAWALKKVETLLGLKNATATEARVAGLIAQSVCETASLYCNGTNTQYSSMTECETHLTEDVRFGSSYELGMDTLLCRMVHQNMVPFRPDVHCSHIGPTGGSYCKDDLQYEEVVREKVFLNSPFVPYNYQKKEYSEE